MMSPRPISEVRGSSNFRQTPLQIIHIVGNFLRIWSVYSTYRYLTQTGASVILFIFSCLVPSSILFLLLQKPWKGRSLSNTQVVPSVINGAITALYFILWGKGLKSCGPLRAILAEYSGAVLGVLSAVLYGRRGHLWKKVGGLIAMLASFYFLSQGWALATLSPFSFKDSLDSEVQTEQVLGMSKMMVPILAGILSALRRVIARRVSLKNQLKRRLHAITIASATSFLFPVAMWDLIIGSSDSNMELPFSAWAFLSTVLFGIILVFYVDSIAEEKLHMVFSSPRHLMAAAGCIIVMEIAYKMDFSLAGFLICSSILGIGIYEATTLERGRKDSLQKPEISNGMLDDELEMPSLPT
ncbi:uncharacterized protein LOC105763142 isoform X1 [Gossypium raimondii]|uniref:EamA domain-containing protein n=1 Tax=Gossypium raimondii TaxID=29730 RepID=A0A0D2T123_GOSRA|nr:uncharacterized protein LOC105763142 isoform X1 [Gossypium raimondii]XP_012436704.1 uncharacterized protein LOC105763142 isoform X1 [Gossypium raimondii]KJB48181.1 hypothetical protein B456_008G055500 [Gossypium raimondii]KJB48182.1 hypothetical protein B456_008G055500 [Gossypium raimondii]